MAKKNSTSTPTKTSHTVEALLVELTRDELLERGQRLAGIEQDLADHYSNEEAIKKQLKSKEATLESERSHLASIVRTKQELRDVRVEIVHDYAAGKVRRFRTDTGEMLDERELHPDERQRDLGLEPQSPFDPLPPPRDLASMRKRPPPTPEERAAAERAQLERDADAMLRNSGDSDLT